MNKNIALIVAGIVFLLVAIAHLLRIILDAQISMAGQALPMWPSYLAIIITLILSIWMFTASKK